MKGEIAMVF